MTAPTGNAVDAYLDQLFDRLAGSGRHGRRVLAEAEDHLLNATEEFLAQGLDRDAAQRKAVARFGDARRLATTVPGAKTNLITVGQRLTTMVWLLTGLAVLTYGLSGMLTWILGWPYERLLAANNYFGTIHAYSTDQPGFGTPLPYCTDPHAPSVPTTGCVWVGHGTLESIDGNYLSSGLFLWAAEAGLILLAALVIARRYTRVGRPAWTPPRSASAVIVTTLFGLATIAFLYLGVTGMLEAFQAWALADLVAACLCGAIGTLAWHRRRIPLPKVATA